MSDLFLTPDEVATITGKKRFSAQKKVLGHMGYSVKVRPDGSFWVPRAQFSEGESKPAEKKHQLNFGALKNVTSAA